MEYQFSIICETDENIKICIHYSLSLNPDIGCDKVYFEYNDPEIDGEITLPYENDVDEKILKDIIEFLEICSCKVSNDIISWYERMKY